MRPPTWLPLTLVALTAFRHQFVDVLAMAFEHPEVARRGLFYVSGGVVCGMLYAFVMMLRPRRPWWLSMGVLLACTWGLLEEAQVTVCRIAWGFSKPAIAPAWRGICDSLTGVPMSTVTLLIPVLVVYWWTQQGTKNGSC